MKKQLLFLTIFCLMQALVYAQNSAKNEKLTYADSVNSGLIKEDLKKASTPRVTTVKVGKTQLTLNYYAPGVRGRVIWGGLVPFDQVWVTGAHSANKFEITSDIKINGQVIKAGIYGLFTIPGKDKWTFILNTNYEQHLSDDYDQKDDVLRLDIKPIQTEMTQRLTFELKEKSRKEGELIFKWENLSFSVPFTTL
ncbi:MAG: DUF2911 domain-containing protein [Bacteroidetes bacterium]|nr:DUF2911 domain-containing protein [Bacteroidota bacterium]